VSSRVGAQGITAVPGALLPQLLPGEVSGTAPVTVTATRGPVDLDAVLLRPELATATFTGTRTVTLLFPVSGRAQLYRTGTATRVSLYDSRGRLVSDRPAPPSRTVWVLPRTLVVLTTG
jgi:hypothetical protein